MIRAWLPTLIAFDLLLLLSAATNPEFMRSLAEHDGLLDAATVMLFSSAGLAAAWRGSPGLAGWAVFGAALELGWASLAWIAPLALCCSPAVAPAAGSQRLPAPLLIAAACALGAVVLNQVAPEDHWPAALVEELLECNAAACWLLLCAGARGRVLAPSRASR